MSKYCITDYNLGRSMLWKYEKVEERNNNVYLINVINLAYERECDNHCYLKFLERVEIDPWDYYKDTGLFFEVPDDDSAKLIFEVSRDAL